MQRVKRSTAVAALPAAPVGGTPGYFAAPNPQAGVEATVPGYEWFNAIQEEICSVITAAGIALDGTNHGQLNAAIYAIISSLVPVLASAAETVAGVNTIHATHPAGVKAAIDTAVSAVVNAAPADLNTLAKLAAAVGNDANAATNLNILIATKLAASAKASTGMAQAGADDTTYMTPLKVAQAISALASIADASTAVKGKIQIASVAEAQAGIDALKSITPETLAAAMLGGVGQTWQNVVGSRVAGTTYYNTTGRPILFAATFNNGGAAFNATSTVNGISLVCYFYTGSGGAGVMVVPPGGSYSASGANLNSWIELR